MLTTHIYIYSPSGYENHQSGNFQQAAFFVSGENKLKKKKRLLRASWFIRELLPGHFRQRGLWNGVGETETYRYDTSTPLYNIPHAWHVFAHIRDNIQTSSIFEEPVGALATLTDGQCHATRPTSASTVPGPVSFSITITQSAGRRALRTKPHLT